MPRCVYTHVCVSLCWLLWLGALAQHVAGVDLYVDCTTGDDDANGTIVAPWRTLIRARNEIRDLQPLQEDITVNILPGDCFGADPVTLQKNYSLPVLPLEAADSSSRNFSIVYAASEPGVTRLLGGPILDPSHWLPCQANASLWCYDLVSGALATYSLGSLTSGGLGQCTNNQAELFYDDAPMILARYPNISPNGTWQYMTLDRVIDALTFIVNDTRPLRWISEPDAWLHGFWSYDWADNYVRVKSISPSEDGRGSVISIDPATPPLYGLVDGARFYGINLLSEIDALGEYSFNRSAQQIVFCSPDGEMSAQSALSLASQIIASVPSGLDQQMTSLSGLTFANLSVLYAKGTGISVANGAGISLWGITSSNHGQSGIQLTGIDNSVASSTVVGTGCAALLVIGGDATLLTSGNNIVYNCTISQYARVCRTYQPGIGWGGVGNAFIRNNISLAPHNGFLGNGNNNLFLENYLTDLCYEVTDSGAWYSGRSWVARGNLIENNTFVRIRNTEGGSLGYPAVQAIYLDDQLAGQEVTGNTFIDCDKGVFVGGGRDVTVRSNVCINTGYCVHIDNRGMNWQAANCAYNASYTGILVQQLFDVNYTQPPYSVAYPEIVDTLTNHPCVPVNIVVANNSYCVGPQTIGFIDVPQNDTMSWADTVVNNTAFKCM